MIEKNIFQSWYTRELHPKIVDKIESYKRLNPDYQYYLFTDADMDRFVDENYGGIISECYHKLNIIVAKVDFWRYLVLYKYGGVYIDMDSGIEAPLDQLIRNEDEAIISPETCPGYYVQWALIFRSGHPILKRIIEMVVDNILMNRYPNDIHRMTGPTVFANVIDEFQWNLFQNTLNHAVINESVDVTCSKDGISYRYYGKNYYPFFTFRHDCYDYLRYKKHWRTEEQEKNLLKVNFLENQYINNTMTIFYLRSIEK